MIHDWIVRGRSNHVTLTFSLLAIATTFYMYECYARAHAATQQDNSVSLSGLYYIT
jgi:positive regulator of sigma E activity